MDIFPIADLPDTVAVVIDKDTGTVLGTNLVVVYVSPETDEVISQSDREAIDYAGNHGSPLLVDLDDFSS